MAFQSFSSIAKKQRMRNRSRIKRSRIDTCELVLCRLSPENEKRKRQVSFMLSEGLCKEAGLYPGDRVDIAFEKSSRTGFIQRVTSGGYALSAMGIEKALIRPGDFHPCKVGFTHYVGMPHISESTACENLAISDKRIAFTFPLETRF